MRDEITTIKVEEICHRLHRGKRQVYALLQAQVIPAIRHRRNWIISREAYLDWEKNFGKRSTMTIQ